MERNPAREGIDGGRVVVALGAALLFASLFVDWYGFGRGPDADGFTAWTAFELVDILLALLALAAIAAAVEPFARANTRIPPGVASAAGPAALLLVIISIVNVPPAAQGFESDLEVGVWLALAGAAIMCAGGLLALNRVSLVVTPRERTAVQPSVAEPPSETETRPL
jgi:hypothetical protein